MRLGRYLVGALCLALGILASGMSVAAAAGSIIYPSDLPLPFTLTLAVTGVLFICMAGYFWVRAVKLTPGDELLADDRGLMVGLMVVTTILLAGAMVWSMMHPDFWAGAISGMLDGSTQ
jgi:hypothetical protein